MYLYISMSFVGSRTLAIDCDKPNLKAQISSAILNRMATLCGCPQTCITIVLTVTIGFTLITELDFTIMLCLY